VTLHDPLTLPQVAAFHAAVYKASELSKSGDISALMFYNALMPGLYACVEKWELKDWPGLSAELFPGTPRKPAIEMAQWLNAEVLKLVNEADEEVPKESTGTPTPKPTDLSAQTADPSVAKS